MFRSFGQRDAAQELMDDFTTGGPELRTALRHLRRLNRLFGASAPALYGIRRLWIEADKPRRFSILDVGAGSGDVNARILQWADANGIDLTITLADVTEEACEEARQLFREEPRVRVQRSNVFELAEGCADIVTASQFAHHFDAGELPRVVDSMRRASRLGVVISDIHRHWIPWAAVWVTTRLISSNKYILNDGPLSVAKGFRADDWKRLAEALDCPALFYAWRPLFRYAVVIGKRELHTMHRSGME
ncbi:methyltransferase domain-containing protein [Paenibacillus solanacearum]|nr:methyltransferase domain-containing protein [Paenibacillus solanacearum]